MTCSSSIVPAQCRKFVENLRDRVTRYLKLVLRANFHHKEKGKKLLFWKIRERGWIYLSITNDCWFDPIDSLRWFDFAMSGETCPSNSSYLVRIIRKYLKKTSWSWRFKLPMRGLPLILRSANTFLTNIFFFCLSIWFIDFRFLVCCKSKTNSKSFLVKGAMFIYLEIVLNFLREKKLNIGIKYEMENSLFCFRTNSTSTSFP